MKNTIFIITLMPEFWQQWMRTGVVQRLRNSVDLYFVDLRYWGEGRHKTVDGRVCGGSAGMVLRPDILQKAFVEAVLPYWNLTWDRCYGEFRDRDDLPFEVILPSPRGKTWNQTYAKSWGADWQQVHDIKHPGKPHKVILCPRYEGIDERFIMACVDQQFSLGDMILSGGDLAAAVMLDTAARCIPGVLGNDLSLHQESFEGSLLDHPHYTKPVQWNGLEVPSILLGGHHQQIKDYWVREQERLTALYRPDLWQAYLTDQKAKKLKE